MALFKKVSAATLALLMTASTVSASAASTKILRTSRIGDANNDGVVNARDYVAIRDYIVGNSTEDYFNVVNADYNFNNKIATDDLMELNKVLMDKRIELVDAASVFAAMQNEYLESKTKAVSKYETTVVKGDAADTTNKVDSELIMDLDANIAKLTVNKDVLFVEYAKGSVNSKLNNEPVVSETTSSTESVDKVFDKVVAGIKAAQDEDAASLPSFDIIELLLKADAASLKNAYAYADKETGDKYILLPAEEIISSTNKGVTDIKGSFIIHTNKDNMPVQIDIKTGTATLGTTYVVVEGTVTFEAYAGTLNFPTEGSEETTPADTTTPDVTTTPEETTPAETTPAETTPAETTPAETTNDVTTSETTPDVNPVTSIKNLEDYKDDSLLTILKKSAKYLANAENVTIKINTDETATNSGYTYSNKTKATAVRDGKNFKVVTDDGAANVFTYNDGESTDTFTYGGIEAYAFYNEDGTADVYANGTLVNGEDNKLPLNWIYRKATKDVAGLRSEVTTAGRSAYANIINHIVEEKKAEVQKYIDANDDFTRLNEDKKKLENDAKPYEDKKKDLENRMAAFEADAKALQNNPNATQADVEALNEKIKEVEREAETLANSKEVKDLEARKTALEADVNATLEKYDIKGMEGVDDFKAEAEAKKAQLEKEQAAFEDFRNTIVNQAKEQANITLPSMDYIRSLVGGKDDIVAKIEDEGENQSVYLKKAADYDKSHQIMIIVDDNFFDTDGTWVNEEKTKTQLVYTLEVIETEELDKFGRPVKDYKPVKAEVKETTAEAVKQVDKNGITKNDITAEGWGVVDFIFPTDEVPATKVVLPAEAKKGEDPIKFVSEEDGEFVRFMSKYIENKVVVK